MKGSTLPFIVQYFFTHHALNPGSAREIQGAHAKLCFFKNFRHFATSPSYQLATINRSENGKPKGVTVSVHLHYVESVKDHFNPYVGEELEVKKNFASS